MNRLLRFVAVASVSALAGCNGIFGDLYDEAPDDNSFAEGFHTTQEKGRYTLMLNARSYNEWIYLDLRALTLERMPIPETLTGEWDGVSYWCYNLVEGDRYTELYRVKTDPQPEPGHWDLAIHHFDVKTHGGMALETDYTSIDALPPLSSFENKLFTPDAKSDTQAIVDFKDMLSFHIGYQSTSVNLVLSRWATMDFTNPPPVYSASGRVYLLRMGDGAMAALHLKSYMSEAGTKGYLTIDIKLLQ